MTLGPANPAGILTLDTAGAGQPAFPRQEKSGRPDVGKAHRAVGSEGSGTGPPVTGVTGRPTTGGPEGKGAPGASNVGNPGTVGRLKGSLPRPPGVQVCGNISLEEVARNPKPERTSELRCSIGQKSEKRHWGEEAEE